MQQKSHSVRSTGTAPVGWYKVTFFNNMTPNFMGLFYVMVTPNIMGLSYVLSLMGLSYVPETHNIMGLSYVE
jgi:hypothetical protein